MVGNFDFLQAEWPQLHAEAKKAERDALFDPRTTCFYARRVVEHTVKWIYRTQNLPEPYKSDLAARPIFHRIRDSIEAHLTIVFAALAVSREAQARTGVSIKKIIQTLRPLRSATISLGTQQITAPPRIPDQAQAILDDLTQGGH